MRVAIIGAGVAGLTAARALGGAGASVRVFDKGRGVGGRLATRDREQGAFDHGAQRFSARSEPFRQEVERWRASGWITETEQMSDEPAFLPVPSANSLARSLALGLEVRSSTRVTSLRRQQKSWHLSFEGAPEEGGFDVVLCTAPAPQSAALLEPHRVFAAELEAIRYDPTWALMLGCERDAIAWPNATFSEGLPQGPIALMVREAHKPGRSADEPLIRLTIHASSAFSIEHLEASPEVVTPLLIDAVRRAWPALAEMRVRFASAQRWRFARVAAPLGVPCLFDATKGLGVAGDGLLGPRIESAWLSGEAIARAVLSPGR
jgi:hypothetical protein